MVLGNATYSEQPHVRAVPGDEVALMLACVSLRGGGTERIVTRLANRISKHRRVGILTLVDEPSFYRLASEIEVFGPRTRPPSDRRRRRLWQLAHAARTLVRERPRQLWVFGEEIVGALTIAGAAAGAEVTQFLRGTPRRSLTGAFGRVNPALARLAARVVVQTEEARELLAPRYGLRRLHVVPNPLELPDATAPMSTRDKAVLYVGSLGRKKNQDLLVRLFGDPAFAPGWSLQLVGDGPARAELELLSSEVGAADRVEFLGARKDVAELLQRAQVFAFPSLEEGFPNALAEALGAGCACVSYACPCGPRELINHDRDGLLVEVGDASGFAEALERLTANLELREALGAAAAANIRRFSQEMVMPQLEALLDTASSGARARR